jgi:hypothetical protein
MYKAGESEDVFEDELREQDVRIINEASRKRMIERFIAVNYI